MGMGIRQRLTSRRLLLTLSVALVPLAAGCGSSASSSLTGRSGVGRGGARATVVIEKTASIQRMTIQRQVDLSGTLMSPDMAKVSSEVAGPIREVLVQLGTEVRPGDVLVRLEPRELQLALDRAESALNQVEAQLGIARGQEEAPPADEEVATVRQASANRDDARAAFTRANALGGRGLVSKVDTDTADTRLKVAEANYQAALDNVRSLKASLLDRRASYELAKKKLADAAIRAPVGGSISERLVQPGEFIRENTPVATIVQMNPLKLKTAVQEKFASVIKIGQSVEFVVEAYPRETFKGEVAYISPAVDQATRTFPVEVMVSNSDRRLKPGFFAKGVVATQLDENVAALDDDAISTMAGVSSVYVIEDAKIRQQTVTLGTRKGSMVEITSGLKGGEMLAASNLNQLATGTTVAIGKAEDAAGRRGGGAARGPGSTPGAEGRPAGPGGSEGIRP
jgi:RND family efflux transporter MFP subunit